MGVISPMERITIKTNLKAPRFVFRKQPADGQHRQKRCRDDVHGKGKIDIALVHPVDVALRALLCSPHKFFIAALRLAEYLDDFNAADVLHRCVVERIVAATVRHSSRYSRHP